jgi:putative heme iron utilization protein
MRVSLGTLECRGGAPYVSLAMVALDHDAMPLLHLSDLADHTRNLRADPRVSLLFDGTQDLAVPLAGERATVQGRAEPAPEPRLLARYLARHPDAAGYAGFRDFHLYRVTVERAHLVAGFGRIHWVDGAAVLLDPYRAPALRAEEQTALEEMNGKHQDAVQLLAGRLLGRDGAGWVMTGLDPEGCDLRRGAEVARLEFDQPVDDVEGVRVELVRLARRARAEAHGR